MFRFVLCLSLVFTGTAGAQECVTCWNAHCPQMQSYVQACEKGAGKRKKDHGNHAMREHSATHADPRPGETKLDPTSGMMLAWIPGGAFTMGCENGDPHCKDDEKPAHHEEVDGFWLGKTDVTVAEYEKCVNAGHCTAPGVWEGTCNWGRRRNHPVNCVTWKQAVAFCNWMGGRLPTATEWEYAAKGGEHRVYPWGNNPVDGKRANYCDASCPEALSSDARKSWLQNGWIDQRHDDGWPATSPVASYPAGRSKWGLWDMAGNVWQWTDTDYDSRSKELRGGSWLTDTTMLRASNRHKCGPLCAQENFGIRCAQ